MSFHIINQRPATVPIESLEPHPQNPNRGNKVLISESIDEHGFFGRILVQESRNRIIAGQHRWDTARSKGATEIPVEFIECDDETALRILLVDNESARQGENDKDVLAELLAGLSNTEKGLLGTGYTTDFLDNLIGEVTGSGDGEIGLTGIIGPNGSDESNEDDGPDDSGELLSLANVTIKEPDHPVSHGDVWRVGKHRLVCAQVLTEWPQWIAFLTSHEGEEPIIFAPYPGPFVPISQKSKDNRFLMVQPDPYIAGHILDQYAAMFGEDAIEKESSTS